MTEVNLELLKWAATQSIPQALLQRMEITQIPDIVGPRLIYMLRTAIYAQRLDQQVVEYPADWWQAFKARFFPAWALHRWPVINTVKTMRLYAWYPDKMIPGERSQFLIQINDGPPA